MARTTESRWFAPAPHDELRGIDLVRFATAIVLATHPLHALFDPDDARELAAGLAADHLPGGLGCAFALAWIALAVQLVCAGALVVRRTVVIGALGSIAVVAGGAVLLYAPKWYVVGGAVDDLHHGIEFNLLLLVGLVGTAWTYWPRRGAADPARAARHGFEVIRIGSALALLPHGLPAFVHWDVVGMRAWGESMSAAGWPCGVALVWSIKSIELSCAVLRLARRFVVLACVGHLSYLVPSLYIEHGLRWFVLRPNDNGIEFTLMLIVCSVACILVYWPRREGR